MTQAGDAEALAFVLDAVRAYTRAGRRPPATLAGLLEAAGFSVRARQHAPQPRQASPGTGLSGDGGLMKLAVTTAGAATMLDVSPRTVDRLVSRGELRRIKVGGSSRIPIADLCKFVEDSGSTEDAG